ncbi:sensor histidine kinase [Saccharothrix syringae]|uniref:Sensor histidine kinase n=1 Tax=Saccharothrix syringae TaxID=103733 RepID=A0A5Q0GVR1_SACSY|nr:sensor histidine kinase [Saccharothrix syringae]QFZ17442.1 sensor histidine kinase [Saccharothrix syringae]
MRTGAARDHVGYYHETAFYGSDTEFQALVVPFLDEGVAAGEPVLVACCETNERLLRDRVADVSGIRFLPGADHYSRPTDAILTYRKLFAEYSGAPQIRVVGDVPHPGVGAAWDWWSRYEAAVNEVFGDYALWGLCPYDLRTTPPGVVADVLHAHPHVAGVGANPDYLGSWTWPDPVPDPLEAEPPLVDLGDPSPAEARHAVSAACVATRLLRDELDDIIYAASEAVTNAITHGKPPVRLRVWADAEHVVVAVSDRGEGPGSPVVGLVPTSQTTSAGLGLWLTHRTCRGVSMYRDANGYTIRLVVGG